MKCALWNELRRASIGIGTDSKVAPKQIYGGICSEQHWYYRILSVPEKLAWILSPIKQYEEMLEPLLYKWRERQAEILSLPLVDQKGKVMPSVGKLIAQIGMKIEDRVLGTPVQRQAHLHADVSSPKGNKPEESTQDEMARLNAEIEALKERERTLQHLPSVDEHQKGKN